MQDVPPELAQQIPHSISLYVRNFWRHPNDPERPYDFYDDKGNEYFYYLTDKKGPLNPHQWGDIVVLLFARGCLKTTVCTMINTWAMDVFKNVEGIVTAPRKDQTQEVMDRFIRVVEDVNLDDRRTRNKRTHQQFETWYYDEHSEKRRAYNDLKSRTAWGEGNALRGIHAHYGVVDEFQDVDEGMFSVFKETVDRSIPQVPYFPVIFVIGTPKMANGFFHQLWEMSDKKEWNDDDKEWFATQDSEEYLPPELLDHRKELKERVEYLKSLDEDKSEEIDVIQKEIDTIQGFKVTGWHIDQYACPRHTPADIAFKEATYSPRKFENEVKANFYTPENDLIAPKHVYNALMDNEGWSYSKTSEDYETYIGVDWGGGDGEGASTSVLTVLERQPDGFLKTLLVDTFPHGMTPEDERERVEDAIIKYEADVVVVDEGYGDNHRAALQNGEGTFKPGGYDMVYGCHYGNVNLKEGLTWSRKGDRSYFTVNRTFMIEAFAEDFKKGKIGIPKKNLEFGGRNDSGTRLLRELTAPYTDKIKTPDGKRKLRVVADDHDDIFHSYVFAWIAANHVRSKRKLKGADAFELRGY